MCFFSLYCLHCHELICKSIDVFLVLFDRILADSDDVLHNLIKVLCICKCCAMGEIDKGMPQIGMRFRNPNEAWLFWVAYGGRIVFDLRKRNKHISKMDGQVTSCTFVLFVPMRVCERKA